VRRLLPTLLLAACSAPASWSTEAAVTLRAARDAGADTVVYFALPGRDHSDRMERQALRDPAVLAALARGGFLALRIDGFAQQRLYDAWIGGGEGMGLCVLDGGGRPYACRPGPQDAPELAAYLDLCAARRPAVLAARAELAEGPEDPQAMHRLALLLLELGCRKETETLLVSAAQRGVLDAHHRLARLYALDGRLQRARQWLRTAVPSPAAQVTEGYVLYKERRHAEAAEVLDAALQQGGLGDDRQRAALFYGKALHEAGRDPEAIAVLEALARERTGSTFEGAALHALAHIRNPEPGHTH
jgi:tetratricopeptide (TPR) repeat protein